MNLYKILGKRYGQDRYVTADTLQNAISIAMLYGLPEEDITSTVKLESDVIIHRLPDDCIIIKVSQKPA